MLNPDPLELWLSFNSINLPAALLGIISLCTLISSVPDKDTLFTVPSTLDQVPVPPLYIEQLDIHSHL